MCQCVHLNESDANVLMFIARIADVIVETSV